MNCLFLNFYFPSPVFGFFIFLFIKIIVFSFYTKLPNHEKVRLIYPLTCLLIFREQYKSAIRDFRRALSLEPQHQNAKLYLETAFLRYATHLQQQDKVFIATLTPQLNVIFGRYIPHSLVYTCHCILVHVVDFTTAQQPSLGFSEFMPKFCHVILVNI